METGWEGSLNSWAGPAPAVIQATMYSKAARQAQETKEELEKIQARIDHMIQAYERVPAGQPAATEVVEDVEQLEAVLGDPVKKRRYQHQVTVFIVGYQESCGQRTSLLRQLQEFFSCSAELGLGEESPGLPDDFPVHMDDVAGTVRAALSSVEAAVSRLADLNKDIVSYVTSALAAHSPKRSHRKQVEKAVDMAKKELVQLKRRLLQAQADVETKERQLKDLQQLSEMKAKESRLCRAQLERTQRRLQGLEQEHGAQQARLEAELRSRDSRIAELDGFLQERARLQRDAATQCSDRAPSSPPTCPGQLLLSSAGAAVPAGRELGDGLAESMVQPGGGVPDPVDPLGQRSEQPQLGAGGPSAHTAVPGPGELAGPAGGCREAREAEEDAEEQTETHPAGGERSLAAVHGAVQAPEDSAMCELLARRLAALEAELAAAQLQSREEAQRWEEERQRLLQQTRQLAETARHQQTAQTAETVRYLATARPVETAQNLEMTWPAETVQNLEPARQEQAEALQHRETTWLAETVQNLEPARQEQTKAVQHLETTWPAETVQHLETARQEQAEAVQLAQRGKTAPQMFAPGSPLTLEARAFPETTPPPTPAGGASPSRGPIRKGAAPGPGASPDALPQAEGRASPAAGRPGADSSLVAFLETLREGLMAKELYSLARLLDSPWGSLTPELSAAPEEAAGAESRRLLGNATVVFNSLLESISDNYEMLLQQQAVPSDQGGAKVGAPGKGVALRGTGPLALDPVGGRPSAHVIVLAPAQPTRTGRELNPRPAPGSAGAERRAPRVRFTPQDEQHNRRALSQGVCRGQVPWALYQDASLLMRGFRCLCRQRFEGLVRGYLAHIYMKEEEEALEQRPSSPGSVEACSVLERLRVLRQQRLRRWRGEWRRGWARQLQLAELLSETLGRAEERSGLLLIRPVLPGPGRLTALTPPRRSHARPQAAPKKPVPALMGQLQEAGSPLATWGLRFHDAKQAAPHMLWSFPAVGDGRGWPEQDPVLPTPVVITPRLLEMDLNGYLLQEHQAAWPGTEEVYKIKPEDPSWPLFLFSCRFTPTSGTIHRATELKDLDPSRYWV